MVESAHDRRGRLSVIDQLPEWADEAKVWAFEQLKRRKKSQLDILDDFNRRLRAAALGEGITDPPQVSRSAFNRTALRIATLGRRLEETREIAEVLAPKFDQEGDASVTLMVAETIKTLINEMLSNAGKMKADSATAEMLMMTSRALTGAEQAKKLSSDNRKKIEAELTARASKAVDQVAKEKGLSSSIVNDIKSRILGIQQPTTRSTG